MVARAAVGAAQQVRAGPGRRGRAMGRANWQPHLHTQSPQGADWGSCFPCLGQPPGSCPRALPWVPPWPPSPLRAVILTSPTPPQAQTLPTGP